MKTTDELADGSVAGGHSKEPLAWDRWAFRGFVAGVLVLVGSAVAIAVTELDGVPLELGEFVARVFESSFVVPLAWASLGSLALGSLISLIQHWLPRRSERKARALGTLAPTGLRELLVEVGARTREALAGDEPDVSLAIDELLRGALSVEASDLHFSPTAADLVVTYRVHGALHEVVRLPSAIGPRLALRVKVLARMDTYARRPQDGRVRHRVGDLQLEARVSSLPADFGERLVLRLVRGTSQVPTLESLGLDAGVEQKLRDLLARPQGLLFVSGPVGSGKTTSLYASLGHIVATRGQVTSLVTLEDPIELQLPFATQTQINTHMGMSFAQTLRSVLRQDPNVLMVGEIRDRETAEIAMQAGLTGHLILTTIHVESAAGTFARMIDMGVEPFTVASATLGCLSQRLVRVLCSHCREAREPDPLVRARLEALGAQLREGTYYEAVGCEVCEGQGYTGRLPVGELLVMSERLREAVHARKSTAEIASLAVAEGMVPLLRTALERAADGTTSLAEVSRVVG